jgi:hypothetical protein
MGEIFTPANKASYTGWPSYRTILGLGKRVIIEADGHDYANGGQPIMFLDFQSPMQTGHFGWPENKYTRQILTVRLIYFASSNCSSLAYPLAPLPVDNFIALYEDETILTLMPFQNTVLYNGPSRLLVLA